MLVKKLIGHLGVHDKTDLTLEVRTLSLAEIIRRPVTVILFCENAPTIWDQHRLEWTFKPSVFYPQGDTPKSLSWSLPFDSGPTQKNILTRKLYLWTIQNTQLLNCFQNNFNSLHFKVIKLIGFPQWIPS